MCYTYTHPSIHPYIHAAVTATTSTLAATVKSHLMFCLTYVPGIVYVNTPPKKHT